MTKYRIIHQSTSIEAPEGAFLIGRSSECHLILDDPSVSRLHAAIIREGNHLYVVDKGSRNGVVVNGSRVEKRQTLKDGDVLEIGHQAVRITAVEQSRDADRTVGLSRCPACDAWIASNNDTCPHCGAPQQAMAPPGSKQTQRITPMSSSPPPHLTSSGTRPLAMLAALALKAVRVGKLDEAEQLTGNVLTMATKRLEGGPPLSNSELSAVMSTLVAMAEAAKSPAWIDHIFDLHLAVSRVMARDLVEKLYELVRVSGYRATQSLARYLSFLQSRAETLTPSERFVHKRLEGLVKLCS